MSATNFLEKVSLEIGQAFLPLRQTVKAGVSDSAFEELFQELGWELRSFLSEEEIKRIRNAVESATEFLDHSNDLSKLVSGLPDLVETFETLFNPSELQFESADFKNSFSELGLRLLDALVISHLQRRFPITHNLLVFLGIIHIRYVPSTESISSHITWDFDWDNLQRIFSEPEKVFRDQRTYHWGHADFDARKLFVNLRNVLWLYGIPVGIQSRDQDSIRVLSPDSTSDPILRIPALTKVQEGIIQQAGASLIPYRATAGEGYAGIALVIFGLAQLEKDFTLGKHWIGTVRGQAEALSTQGIVWDFQKGLSLSPLPGEGFRPPNFEIFVALIKKSEADSKDILFGSPTGSNLSVGTFGFRGGVELKANSISEIFLETFIEQASLKITAGSDDAFLKKALPNGVVIPFDLIVGSSTDRGLYFGGSAGLSVKFPIRKTLGPLCVHAITLKAHIGEEAKLNAVAAISFSLKLGPATVSLDEVGLDFGVLISRRPSFSVNPYGPSGGGISIKAAGVTGGGYLSFDKANHLYSGALQLQFAKVGLDAIGFITTGGPEGFSLVININTRFTPPVQLSFGFMLVAVGGLIAINRTLSVEALQAGMLDGTLDSLLFPPNPVAQAPRIIQDLQRVLPAQDGRYVVGPMLRLTWGAKSLVKIDLGLFFELPNPLRMLLAGQLDVAVPHEDKALIKFQAAILGLLDLGRKVLAIDTRIKEGSHIVGFEVLGDTALRLSWGEKPYFLLSMGGFHPKFPVPAVYPALPQPFHRLSLVFDELKFFHLSCESYFAITSNSLQFGANANLYVKLTKRLKVEGYLGYDTLIMFSPFFFEVGIRAGVAVKWKKRTLMGVALEFTLSGPRPWRAKGKGKIKILFVKISIGFDVSWGTKDPVLLDTINPVEVLQQALEDPDSWGSLLPPHHLMGEALDPFERLLVAAPPDGGSPETPAPSLIMHPAGTLEIRQKVVPLGIRLDTLQNAPVTKANRVVIDHVTVGNQVFQDPDLATSDTSNPVFMPVEEHFAPCQFVACPPDARLTKPAFELMEAGVSITSGAVAYATPPGTFNEAASLEYESLVIDEDLTTVPGTAQRARVMPRGVGKGQWLGNAAAARARRALRPFQSTGGAAVKRRVRLAPPAYQVVEYVEATGAFQPMQAEALRPYQAGRLRAMTRLEADQVVSAIHQQHPDRKGRYAVLPETEVVL